MKNKNLLFSFIFLLLFKVSVFATDTFWNTNWNAMRISTINNEVTGEYIYDDGVISGILAENNLTGWWRESNNPTSCGPSNQWSGPLLFTFANDGQSFLGDWGYCSSEHGDLDPLGSGWTGTRRESGYTEAECLTAGRSWCDGNCQIQECGTEISQTECENGGKIWCNNSCRFTQCSIDEPITIHTQGTDTSTYGDENTTEHSTSIYLIGSPVSTCNSTMAKAYIKFDINEFPNDIEQVLLGVTHYEHTESCNSNCTADFYFYPILEPWEDNTLVYDNMPLEGSPAYGPLTISVPNNFSQKEYDITSLYLKWKSGVLVNNGISIHSPTVGCNNEAAQFKIHSFQAEDTTTRPYLKVIRKVTNKNSQMPAILYLLLD